MDDRQLPTQRDDHQSNSHSGNLPQAGPGGRRRHLSQDLATTPGSLHAGLWLRDGHSDGRLTVKWGGTAVMGLVNQPAQGYTEYSFPVVATSTTTHLEFDYRKTRVHWRLDDISVVAAARRATVAVAARR